jgi:hypothetical protein
MINDSYHFPGWRTHRALPASNQGSSLSARPSLKSKYQA